MNNTGGTHNVGAPQGKNIVESAIEAGKALGERVYESPVKDGAPFVILREADGGEVVHYLGELESPPRISGIYTLHDAASFLQYWKNHSDQHSVCYASMEPAQFLAVIDHHEATNEPEYGQHRALYKLTHSVEWNLWTGRNGKAFEGNTELAAWIENQVPDIVEPSGAQMLEIALNLKVNSAASFGNQINLANGKTEFNYTNQVEGSANVKSGKIQIPEQFVIEIPVFAGINAPKYRMEVRFRYRLQSGALKIWFELVRPHKVIEQAFSEMLDAITTKIGRPVLFGTPA